MTEKEQDELLFSILRQFIKILIEANEYEKQQNYPDSKKTILENEKTISVLSGITAEINSIEQLAELDEDIIDIVFEALAEYEGDFTVSAELEQRKKDLEFCKKMDELVWLFTGGEDSESEEDEFEEEEEV